MCGSEVVGGLGTEVQMNDSTHWGQSEVFEVGSERRELTPMPTPCCAQLRADARGGGTSQQFGGDRWLPGVAL